MPVQITNGVRYSRDGESWTRWTLYPRLTEEQIQDILGDTGDYEGGPGQAFYRRGYARSSTSYTLIKQSGGLDI